jgi:hypothetical protein
MTPTSSDFTRVAQHLRDYLLSPAGKPVPWVTGPSGIGKTELVRSVVKDLNASGVVSPPLELIEISTAFPGSGPAPASDRHSANVHQSLRSGDIFHRVASSHQPVIFLDDFTPAGLAPVTPVSRLLSSDTERTSLRVVTAGRLDGAGDKLTGAASPSLLRLSLSPSLETWEAYLRERFPLSPHADIADLLTGYLRRHPDQLHTSGQVPEMTPRAWTLCLEEHALLFHLPSTTAFVEHLSDIYHRYLPPHPARQVLTFIHTHPLPTIQDILVGGQPARPGWRLPDRLPTLVREVAETLPGLLWASPTAETAGRYLLHFTDFIRQLEPLQATGPLGEQGGLTGLLASCHGHLSQTLRPWLAQGFPGMISAEQRQLLERYVGLPLSGPDGSGAAASSFSRTAPPLPLRSSF